MTLVTSRAVPCPSKSADRTAASPSSRLARLTQGRAGVAYGAGAGAVERGVVEPPKWARERQQQPADAREIE